VHLDHPVNEYADIVDDSTQFIDVRESHEVAEGTIPGTIHIALGDLPDRIAELDPSRRVVLLCRSGGRSTQAAEFFVASGFSDVYNLEGGILAWTG